MGRRNRTARLELSDETEYYEGYVNFVTAVIITTVTKLIKFPQLTKFDLQAYILAHAVLDIYPLNPRRVPRRSSSVSKSYMYAGLSI